MLYRLFLIKLPPNEISSVTKWDFFCTLYADNSYFFLDDVAFLRCSVTSKMFLGTRDSQDSYMEEEIVLESHEEIVGEGDLDSIANDITSCLPMIPLEPSLHKSAVALETKKTKSKTCKYFVAFLTCFVLTQRFSIYFVLCLEIEYCDNLKICQTIFIKGNSCETQKSWE